VARGPLNKALDRLYEAFGAPVVARSSSIAEVVQPIADVDAFVPMSFFIVPLEGTGAGAANAILDLEIPPGVTATNFWPILGQSATPIIINSQSQALVVGGFREPSWTNGRASRCVVNIGNAVVVAPAPQLIITSIAAGEFYPPLGLLPPIVGPRHLIFTQLVPGIDFNVGLALGWREVASPAA